MSVCRYGPWTYVSLAALWARAAVPQSGALAGCTELPQYSASQAGTAAAPGAHRAGRNRCTRTTRPWDSVQSSKRKALVRQGTAKGSRLTAALGATLSYLICL